jgi:isoquinoline 1-oxidoreductase beta subunit
MQGHLKLGLSRRHFLFAGAAAGGGMMIGWAPTAEAKTNDSSVRAPSAFIRIDRQNKVTIVSPMIEMGQGTFTALPMLVAEELDIDVKSVAVDHAPANDKLYGNPIIGNEQITGGSTSIRAFYLPLRTDTGYVVDASRNRRLSCCIWRTH